MSLDRLVSGAFMDGSVNVRPLRPGLVIRSGDDAAFRRAVDFCSTSWGGIHIPLLELDAEGVLALDAVSLSRARLDYFGYVDEDDSGLVEAVASLNRRHGRSPRSRLESIADLRTSLVDSSAVLRSAWGEEQTIGESPVWPADEPMDRIFAAAFGSCRSAESAVADRLEALEDRLGTAPLREAIDGSDLLYGGRVGLAQLGCSVHNVRSSGGFFVFDDVDPPVGDLVRFWNVRAGGYQVLPWIEGAADSALNEISNLAVPRLRYRRWGGDETLDVAVFVPGQWDRSEWDPNAEQLKTPELEALLEQFEGVRHVRVPYGAGGSHVLDEAEFHTEPQFREYFNAHGESRYDDAPVSFSFPVPSPFHEQYWPDLKATIAVDIDVHSETGLSDHGSLALPSLEIDGLDLGRLFALPGELVYGTGRGATFAIRLGERRLDVRVPEGRLVILRLLAAVGLGNPSIGDAGIWYERMLADLGGPGDQTARQPSVRAVVEAAAAPSAVSVNQLNALIGQNAGEWSDQWPFARHSREYRDVVKARVAGLQMLEAALVFDCRRCHLRQHVTAEHLSVSVSCVDCGHTSPLAAEVAAGATWRFHARGRRDPSLVRAGLAVAAAVQTINTAVAGWPAFRAGIMCALGVEVEIPGVGPRELDYVLLLEDPDVGPTVIVGEAKYSTGLDSTDVDTLTAVQHHLRARGVECFVSVATLADEFPPSDAELLRGIAAPEPVSVKPGRGYEPVRPLVLDGRRISTPPNSRGENDIVTGPERHWSMLGVARWAFQVALGDSEVGE